MQGKLIIDENAIQHNIDIIREKSYARIIAVVKADGYGLGLEKEYRILKKQGVNMFAFSDAQEALALRRLGCQEDILVMTPTWDMDEACALIQEKIIMTWESLEQAAILLFAGKEMGVTPRVHIKIDTGMGRYGFLHSQIPDLSEWGEVFNIEGCFSHLAGHKRHYRKSVMTQLGHFNEAIETLKAQGINPKLIHLSNTRALMTFGDLGFNGIRIGSAIVGKCVGRTPLQEAVWLEAPVFSIVQRPKGSSVGYQSQTILKRDSRLAIIRVGHGCGGGLCNRDMEDNPFRNLFTAAKRIIKPLPQLSVQIAGMSCQIMGKMGVAHMVVDVTDTDIKVGDVMRMSVNPLHMHPYMERVSRGVSRGVSHGVGRGWSLGDGVSGSF